MEIKYIIFDLGETVLTDDFNINYHDFFNEMSEYYGVDADSLENARKVIWKKYRIGKISEDDFWKQLLEMTNAKRQDTKAAKEFWKRSQKPKKGMLGLIAKLKKNYSVSALTNISKEWFDYKRNKFKLDEYFDHIVASAYVGIAKPDKGIYEIMLRELEAKPEQCLFIDNAQKCMPMANELGMNTILFAGLEDLKGELKRLGIKY